MVLGAGHVVGSHGGSPVKPRAHRRVRFRLIDLCFAALLLNGNHDAGGFDDRVSLASHRQSKGSDRRLGDDRYDFDPRGDFERHFAIHRAIHYSSNATLQKVARANFHSNVSSKN